MNKWIVATITLFVLGALAWSLRWQALPLFAAVTPVESARSAIRIEPAFAPLEFDRPLYLTHAPGDPTAVYVVTQPGLIYRIDRALSPPRAETFLDLRESVSTSGSEEGLLGLAFHPDYMTTRQFYVYYSASAGARRTVLARFDARTRQSKILIEFAQPYSNHKGGWIGFGPDRMLYVALGDGGSGNDPQNRAQDLGELLGKVLRLTPEGKPAPGNPFESVKGARPEIWAYGLRNPWRMSFDRVTGELWAADVGQDQIEEIDRVVRGGNYGWRLFEGNRSNVNLQQRAASEFAAPVHTYDHSQGQSITGGYVYRGAQVPSLKGQYVFGDFVQGRIWALRLDEKSRASVTDVGRVPLIASFGEDADGELYVCSFGGRIYRFAAP